MTVLKARSRKISVRLSEEEYAAVRRLCSAAGARCVSDFARDAMLASLTLEEWHPLGNDRTEALQTQMQLLNQRIEELSERILSTHQRTNA
jgi:hypothetical protein